METESQEIQVTLVCAEDGAPDALWRAKGSGLEMLLCQLDVNIELFQTVKNVTLRLACLFTKVSFKHYSYLFVFVMRVAGAVIPFLKQNPLFLITKTLCCVAWDVHTG